VKTSAGLRGVGHAIGSAVVSNADVSRALGLSPNWLTARTGIVERRVPGDGEDVLSLATSAIRNACDDAGLSLDELGQETVLLHIQVGPVSVAPPAAHLLAGRLGLQLRVLGVDGMCAEPIPALEMGLLMLGAGRCRRMILSTAADFLSLIDSTDPDTTGLFGSGAGAVILESAEQSEPNALVHSLYWETHPQHWELGQSLVLGTTREDKHAWLDVSYYTMDGQRLAKVALGILPQVLDRVLDEAGWTRDDVDLVLAHQPNTKMLEIGVRALGLNPKIVPMPVRHMGNLGPASMFVNLSLARADGKLKPGTKVLLIAFGLGFSCGAAAIEL
jgi:3-oxoacyl-[acyl-carrier-protein] synthase III